MIEFAEIESSGWTTAYGINVPVKTQKQLMNCGYVIAKVSMVLAYKESCGQSSQDRNLL